MDDVNNISHGSLLRNFCISWVDMLIVKVSLNGCKVNKYYPNIITDFDFFLFNFVKELTHAYNQSTWPRFSNPLIKYLN